MEIVLSWLNEFAPFGDDVPALAAALTDLGLAVEEVVEIGTPIEGVVVAKVLERAKHPNADRIGLVFVDRGDGESLQICCGAFNMQPGDLVPLATIGTVMPDGRAIQRSKMRGEWSNGMLCSGTELGITADAAGIHILPPGLPLGAPVFEALGITRDVVFDLDLTRNRPDAWGHLGVARDLAAKLGLPFTPPSPTVEPSGPPRTAPVEIVAPERCGRFTSTVITGIEVKPSPAWIADRLGHAGMRPINNVVDASNYVMLELNEPNHAYDLDTLGGGGFRVRLATDGERLVTLDGTERTLTAADLLICDAHDVPIGLAGIMGGAHTEISESTTTVAFEAAWFHPFGIAASVSRLGLRSEASARFERGRDPFGIDRCIARFVELLRETCPRVAVAPGAVDARGELPAPTVVRLRPARVNALLGLDLDPAAIAALLTPIGFACGAPAADGTFEVTVPSWRPDSTAEIDLVEEVARHHGYAALGRRVPPSAHPGSLSPYQRDRRLVRQVLLGAGVSEAMPNPFLAPGDLERAGLPPEALVITNPLAAEESVLRTSLRPGMLKAVAYNASHRRAGVSLFEIGHTYRHHDGADVLPDEREIVGVALAGREAPAAVALWLELAAALGVEGTQLVAATEPGLHPTRTAHLVAASGAVIGRAGEIDPDVAAAHGIAERVAWLEVDLGRLLSAPHGERRARPVSRYPSSDVDLAFALPDATPAAELTAALVAAGGVVVADLALFDVYRGVGLPEGTRSLAYRLRLQAPDRTLTDTDVAEVRQRAITAAEQLGATLRG